MIKDFVLENKTTGEKLSFRNDTLKDEYILASYEISPVEAEFYTTAYIDMVGNHVDSTFLSERDIYIKGAIYAENKDIMDRKKRKIKAFFNPQDEILLKTGGYVLTFQPSKTILEETDPLKRDDKTYLFHLYGIAHYPLWKKTEDTVTTYTGALGVPIFPMIIPEDTGMVFGFVERLGVNTLSNIGDVPVGFIARIEAADGDVTNPKIVNTKTGEFIEVRINMTIGDMLTVSTVSGNKYVTLKRGTSETDVFRLVTLESTMSMKLDLGVSTVQITASGNSSNISASVSYSPAWLDI